MPFQKKYRPRLAALSILLAIILVFYSARIFTLQISNAETYINQALGISYRTVTIKAKRGEILDANGRKLAVNRDGYNIVFNKAYLKTENLNSTIISLCRLLEKRNSQWNDALPITNTLPYTFNGSDSSVARLKSTLGLAHYASAEDCISKMQTDYSLDGYNAADSRIIMGVRYSLVLANFSISNPYTFADDVPTDIMQIISETGILLNGVSIETVPVREYPDGTIAPHIIGTVGKIYAEEWHKYKDKNYSYNDVVGKSGIEQLAEEYLHGTDGEITYKIDSKGNILESTVTKLPIAGKTVVLTLDKAIQQKTQNALAQAIKTLQNEGGTATAGAAIMMEVDTGNILASANYPTYDLNTFRDVYDQLLKDPNLPLTDRAFSGIYPPGSTVKPLVALASIEQNVLDLEHQNIRCTGTYNYFDDYKPSCMFVHGSIGLNTALAKSCNYYFYELGRKLGVSSMLSYFNKFGLGVSTGLDLPSGSGLIIDEKSEGLGGATLQTAIGQMNAFTPLQLTNYAATVATEGRRYKSNLLNRIVSPDMRTVYSKTSPSLLSEFAIDSTAIKVVKDGMLSVTEAGTGSAVLKDYPIKIGGKTGTSQVNDGAEHSIFIAFAPFDKPQIAITVILEHGNNTRAVTSVARAMLDAYFFQSEETVDTSPPFVVLP